MKKEKYLTKKISPRLEEKKKPKSNKNRSLHKINQIGENNINTIFVNKQQYA